jgi:hypothetical protein
MHELILRTGVARNDPTLLYQVHLNIAFLDQFFEGQAVYDRDFMPALALLVLSVLRDPKFPKRKREARINFLADSLAGLGRVTARRSRDICEQERAKARRAHYIIRYEFFVECSCGYKGQSRNHACPKCRAEIVFYPDSIPSG